VPGDDTADRSGGRIEVVDLEGNAHFQDLSGHFPQDQPLAAREPAADDREDTVVVSEKVAILLTGRAIPVGSPGRVARAMSRFVRPPAESYGLSVPEKMQFVVDSVGVWRVFAAAAVSAMTRPIGVRGVFYRVAGPLARDVDGALPPYEHLLFPPLPQADAAQLCAELQSALGVGVCIADLNDFGGRIRAASPLAPPIPVLSEVLADNPLGQRLTGTPFGLIRPLSEESQPSLTHVPSSTIVPIQFNTCGHTFRCALRPTRTPTCCSATPTSPW
jgi:hypothetical protein